MARDEASQWYQDEIDGLEDVRAERDLTADELDQLEELYAALDAIS